MLPIGDVTQFELIIALVACIAALSLGYWRWITGALSLPIFYFGILARMGLDESGFVFLSFLIMFEIALFGGLAWGWLVRRILGNVSILAVITVAALPALAFAGYALERQYVPHDCRNNGAVFSMADHNFSMPKTDGFLKYSDKQMTLTQYRWKKKQSWNFAKRNMAEYCRLTENGTLPLDLTAVRVGQRNVNTEFNLIPSMNARPNWDWSKFSRAASYQIGSETNGAECYTRASATYPTFSCAVWETPLPSIQIYAVSIRNKPIDTDEAVSLLRRELSLWFSSFVVD